MKIGIIGYGVVGKAAYETLKKEFKIVKFDKYQQLDNFEDILACELVFIMVPTPFDCKINEVDDSAVQESLSKLADASFNNTVIIKSTLPPGYSENYAKTYNFDIVFNPEFLRESTTPNDDFANQDVVVIGTQSQKIFEKIKKMYCKVLRSDAKYYHTSLTEAEMVKSSQNTMLASRVAIANVIYDACQKFNIDYKSVREIAFDNFDILGPHMVQVPGPDGKRGFGGKCLPKDIRAFTQIYNSALLEEIINYNDDLRDDLDLFLDNYSKSP